MFNVEKARAEIQKLSAEAKNIVEKNGKAKEGSDVPVLSSSDLERVQEIDSLCTNIGSQIAAHERSLEDIIIHNEEDAVKASDLVFDSVDVKEMHRENVHELAGEIHQRLESHVRDYMGSEVPLGTLSAQYITDKLMADYSTSSTTAPHAGRLVRDAAARANIFRLDDVSAVMRLSTVNNLTSGPVLQTIPVPYRDWIGTTTNTRTENSVGTAITPANIQTRTVTPKEVDTGLIGVSREIVHSAEVPILDWVRQELTAVVAQNADRLMLTNADYGNIAGGMTILSNGNTRYSNTAVTTWSMFTGACNEISDEYSTQGDMPRALTSNGSRTLVLNETVSSTDHRSVHQMAEYKADKGINSCPFIMGVPFHTSRNLTTGSNGTTVVRDSDIGLCGYWSRVWVYNTLVEFNSVYGTDSAAFGPGKYIMNARASVGAVVTDPNAFRRVATH